MRGSTSRDGGDILQLVCRLLRPANPRLQAISLRISTPPGDNLKDTALWWALCDLRDPRIRVGQVAEDVASCDVQRYRLQDIYRAYVTGEEDPWSFGEVVWTGDESES